MLLIWGKRETRKRMGYAAGYCMCCRSPVLYYVRELREVTHLYYVPLGTKRLAYEGICSDCSSIQVFSLDSFGAFVKESDFERAIEFRTTPGIEESLVRSEYYQEALLKEPVGSPMRIDDFVHVLRSMEYMSEYILRRSSSQSITALVQLGMLVSFISAVFAAAGYAGGIYVWMWYVSVVVMVTLCVYRMAVSSHKNRVASVEPLLVRSFAPLEPTVDEIRMGCERCVGVSYAKRINPQKLVDAIDMYNYGDL